MLPDISSSDDMSPLAIDLVRGFPVAYFFHAEFSFHGAPPFPRSFRRDGIAEIQVLRFAP